MFKIKFDTENKNLIISKLNIMESDDYSFVLCDEIGKIEMDKINILFQSNQLDLLSETIQFLNVKNHKLMGKNYRGSCLVDINDIEVVEAYGNEIYTIVNKNRIDFNLKLYQLETMLEQWGFMRISKSELINVNKVIEISSAFNGKLTLQLISGRKIDVNRSYKKKFIERIEGESL